GSEAGLELAARTADVVFSVVQELSAAKRAYRDLKGRMARYGRTPDQITVLPGVMPIIGSTEAEARDKLSPLPSRVTATTALTLVTSRIGYDVTGLPLDGPVPAPPTDASSQTFSRVLYETARRENMTLRDLYNLTAAARGHWVLCGTPKRIADTLEEWFVEEAADGFNVLPPYFPGALADFVDQVVPGFRRADCSGVSTRARPCVTTSDCRACPRRPAFPFDSPYGFLYLARRQRPARVRAEHFRWHHREQVVSVPGRSHLLLHLDVLDRQDLAVSRRVADQDRRAAAAASTRSSFFCAGNP